MSFIEIIVYLHFEEVLGESRFEKLYYSGIYSFTAASGKTAKDIILRSRLKSSIVLTTYRKLNLKTYSSIRPLKIKSNKLSIFNIWCTGSISTLLLKDVVARF
jgi:hypothetical protein